MGIYDRDYYREDSRWHNPLARSQGTVFLILLYCFVFIAQIASNDARGPAPPDRPDEITATLQLDVKETLKGEVWRIVSYAVIHQPWNIFHLVFTAVFLAWIGHQVEDLYGSKEYLAYFLLTTLFGGIVYTAVSMFTNVNHPLIGPSGAVTSILVLFALHYPAWRFFYFPIWVIVVVYAFTDIAGLAGGTANPAAVAVHLTGAAFAFLYHTYTLRVLNWLPGGWGSSRAAKRQPRPRLRVKQEKPQPEPAAAVTTAGSAAGGPIAGGSGVDEHLEAKLDEVLQKVAKFGKESLTDTEREILLKASEIYKKRRRPG
jgi:membrane associated rhomboid family serine protease